MHPQKSHWIQQDFGEREEYNHQFRARYLSGCLHGLCRVFCLEIKVAAGYNGHFMSISTNAALEDRVECRVFKRLKKGGTPLSWHLPQKHFYPFRNPWQYTMKNTSVTAIFHLSQGQQTHAEVSSLSAPRNQCTAKMKGTDSTFSVAQLKWKLSQGLRRTSTFLFIVIFSSPGKLVHKVKSSRCCFTAMSV